MTNQELKKSWTKQEESTPSKKNKFLKTLYQPGKTETAEADHTAIPEEGIGGNYAGEAGASGENTSTAVESITDTKYRTVRERSNRIWQLIVAKETHITETPTEENQLYSKKVIEPSQRTSEPPTAITIKQNNKQSKPSYKSMKSSSKQVTCDICGFKNHETEKCYHYLHCHATIQEARTAYVAYKDKKGAKSDAGSDAGSDSDRDAKASTSKSGSTKGTISESHNSIKSSNKRNIKSKWDPSKRTKSEEPNINSIKSNYSKRVPCKVCGYNNHKTEDCFHYRPRHASVEEAKQEYLATQDKRNRKAGSDSGRDADASKSKPCPTKGTTEPSNSNMPTYKVNMIRSNLSAHNFNLPSKNNSMETVSENKITLGYDMCADVGVIPERLSSKLKVTKGKSTLTRYRGAEIRSTGYVTNTLGLSIINQSEHPNNIVIISHFQASDHWNYVCHDHNHMSLVSNRGDYTIKFEIDPAKFGTRMPQAIIPAEEFYRLYHENNYMLNKESSLITKSTGGDGEYYSTNKFNNKYLNKYSELRGSVKPICCSTNNYSDKLKDDNHTETIEFGDFKPAAIERDYGQQEPAAIERDYGQQDSTEGLDPGVPKNGVKPRSSPSCVI
jgi:hypothetical protein